MPQITEVQLAHINTWLQKRGVNMTCESCGRREWETGGVIAGIFVDIDGNATSTTQGLPMVAMGCSNCGNIRLYSAVQMGLSAERR